MNCANRGFSGIVHGHGELWSAGAGLLVRGRWMLSPAERPRRIRQKQNPARRAKAMKIAVSYHWRAR
jgi:hypothetical protein